MSSSRLRHDKLSNLPFVLPGTDMTDELKKPTIEDAKEVHRVAEELRKFHAADPQDETLDRPNARITEGLDKLIASMPHDEPLLHSPQPGRTAIEEYVALDQGPSFGLLAEQAKIAAASSPTRKYWTQRSINEWQESIFGRPKPPVVWNKLMDESEELQIAFSAYMASPTTLNKNEVAKEIADNIIMMLQLCGVLDITINDVINEKMDTNVKREWNVDENGSGQHKPGS